MPNWCDTRYYIMGDAAEIERLDEFIKRHKDKKYIPGADSEGWLGNLLCGVLIDCDNIKEEDIETAYEAAEFPLHRGWMRYYERISSDQIAVDVDDAWGPHNEVFDIVFEKLGLESCEYYYLAHEPGMGIYCSNDVDMRCWDDEFDYCVDFGPEKEDQKDGVNLDYAENWMDKDTLVAELYAYLGEPVPVQNVSDEAVDTLVERVRNSFTNESSYICLYKLQRG